MITLVLSDLTILSTTLHDILSMKRHTVLYFYPKDDTSWCTLEAITFSDYKKDFDNLDCNIIWVSHDSDVSHIKFCKKHHLTISLISDTSLELHQDERFQTRKEKSMYGKKYMGTERSTFVLDTSGTLLREWRKVSVPNHIEEVLAFIQDLH